MNRLIVLILTFLCLTTEASDQMVSLKNLRDPVFLFDINEQGSINQLSHDALKKLFKEEAKSKHFPNINMWIFADVVMPDSSRYLIVDGGHPISATDPWNGETEQLGGLVVLVKNSEVKIVSDTDIFNDEFRSKLLEKGQLDEKIYKALAHEYVNKLIIFLGGIENAKTKFSSLCYISFQALGVSKSTALQFELDKAGLISIQRMKQMKEMSVPENNGNGLVINGVRYVSGVNCPQ